MTVRQQQALDNAKKAFEQGAEHFLKFVMETPEWSGMVFAMNHELGVYATCPHGHVSAEDLEGCIGSLKAMIEVLQESTTHTRH